MAALIASKIPCPHIDLIFAGPIQGASNLILVDSYSDWSKVIPLKSVTTATIINTLHQVFDIGRRLMLVRQREHLSSRYSTLTSDQKTDLLCLGVPKFQTP
ncbi:hypothetical protein ACTXT7_005106 [Hymenolepis weldensis]